MGFKKIMAAALTAGLMLSFVPAVSMADTTGWKNEGNCWKYYTYEDGYVSNAWKKIDGTWYYFGRYGIMVAGVRNYQIDNKYYDFKSNGECLTLYGKSRLEPGWNKVITSGVGYNSKTQEAAYSYSWVYAEENGDLCRGWRTIGGSKYYFDNYNGVMYSCDTGGRWIDGHTYWFKESGEMVTGWYYGGGYWRYAGSDGVMYEYKWLNEGGKSYYFDWAGRMLCNVSNYCINEKYYSFDSSGNCINPEGSEKPFTKGWVKENSDADQYSWYYIGDDGLPCKGWQKIDGKWYYFSAHGNMYTGKKEINGDWYCFKETGEMVTGWYRYQKGNYEYWVYAGSNGKLYCSKWLNSGGKWYYFDVQGIMLENAKNFKINGIYYDFDASGACKNPDAKAKKITGWFETDVEFGDPAGYYGKAEWYGFWYYYDQDGNMYTDRWLNSGGKWYYFKSDGRMVNYDDYYIKSEGKVYDFAFNGVCRNPYNGRPLAKG